MSLNLYLARHPRNDAEPRLIVARTFGQAEDMMPPHWNLKVATRMEAYRYGKLGIELEYANPKYKDGST